MAWLGWLVSVILALGGLFVYFRKDEKQAAAMAAGEGYKALSVAQGVKIEELEAAVKALRAREKVRNAVDATKVKSIPDGMSYLRDAFGGLHPDRPGSSGLPKSGV